MKTKIFLPFILGILLIANASAVVVYGGWSQGESATAEILDGESINFNVDFFSMNPPIIINVKLYDAESNLIYIFEQKTTNTYSFFKQYTITKDIYEKSGNFELIISGSDETNSDIYTLNLNVRQSGISDTDAPELNIIYPVNGKTYTSNQIDHLTFYVFDENLDKCWYSINGDDKNEIACHIGTNTIEFDVITFAEGENTWKVYAEDTYGNKAEKSVTFYFNFEAPAKEKTTNKKAKVIESDKDYEKAYLKQFEAKTILLEEPEQVQEEQVSGTNKLVLVIIVGIIALLIILMMIKALR